MQKEIKSVASAGIFTKEVFKTSAIPDLKTSIIGSIKFPFIQ